MKYAKPDKSRYAPKSLETFVSDMGGKIGQYAQYVRDLENQYNEAVSRWKSQQGDLARIENNSPLKIELGKSSAPKKATDKPESTNTYSKLASTVSEALAIPTSTGVQQ